MYVPCRCRVNGVLAAVLSLWHRRILTYEPQLNNHLCLCKIATMIDSALLYAIYDWSFSVKTFWCFPTLHCVPKKRWSRFLGSQPAGDSHKPGGRLPLLSTRLAITFSAEEITPLAGTKLYYFVGGGRHTGVSSLPKATTQWCPARIWYSMIQLSSVLITLHDLLVSWVLAFLRIVFLLNTTNFLFFSNSTLAYSILPLIINIFLCLNNNFILYRCRKLQKVDHAKTTRLRSCCITSFVQDLQKRLWVVSQRCECHAATLHSQRLMMMKMYLLSLYRHLALFHHHDCRRWHHSQNSKADCIDCCC